MNLKSTLFYFLLISSFTLYAQPRSKFATVNWGPEIKAGRKASLNDIIGYDKMGLYTLSNDGRTFGGDASLDHYDKNLNQIQTAELDLREDKKKKTLEFVFMAKNGELFLFSSFINQSLKMNFLFYQTINKKTLKPNNDMKKIAEIPFVKRYRNGEFNFSFSRDSSKVLVFYDLPYEKEAPKKFGFHVFDDNMNLMWEDEATLPYLDELFTVERRCVDNQGNVYVLGTEYTDKRVGKRKGKPNYKYRALIYTKGSKEVQNHPIVLTDRFITDMQIAIMDNGDIICAGFYSDHETYTIKGTYFLKIDGKTKEIVNKSFKEFTIDFVMQNMTEKEQKKTAKKVSKGKDVELYEYDLDEIILREDGGVLLIGEQYYIRVVTNTYTDANGATHTTTTYYYYYNDIIVVNINPSGQIEWAEKIPKRQVSTNDGGFYSSYSLAIVQNKLYFMFNDNPKNLFYKGVGKLYNYNPRSKESLAVIVGVGMDGKQEKEALFTQGEAETRIRPKVSEQVSNNQMVIFGKKGKKQRLAWVNFK